MSYYFAIIGTQDNPLFEYEFGTSKQGGDGMAHFLEDSRHLNQLVLHSSLDMVEEMQWATGNMYLKLVDKVFQNYISCLVTPSNVKFLLLHQPTSSLINPASSSVSASASASAAAAATTTSSGVVVPTTSRSSAAIGANPTSPQTEEAIRQFFTEVFESWVKTAMNPFYGLNNEIKSPLFRQKVAAAGRKYL